MEKKTILSVRDSVTENITEIEIMMLNLNRTSKTQPLSLEEKINHEKPSESDDDISESESYLQKLFFSNSLDKSIKPQDEDEKPIIGLDKEIKSADKYEEILGMCHRLSWKGTKREHICNGNLYKYRLCYYHWSITYPHETRHGPNSRGRKGGNRW